MGDELQEAFESAHTAWARSGDSFSETVAAFLPAVRACMDARVADARADERAKVYAEIDAHWASGVDGG